MESRGGEGGRTAVLDRPQCYKCSEEAKYRCPGLHSKTQWMCEKHSLPLGTQRMCLEHSSSSSSSSGWPTNR